MSSIALCIPAYNAAKYLPRLLKSAHQQIIPFDEILVYNDASIDNTTEIAKQYGARVISGTTNKGCSYGKNILGSEARSTWLHFHDADDELLPNFTTEMHKWIRSKSSDRDVLILNFEYRDFNTKNLLGTANHNQILMQEDPLKYVISHKIVNFGLYRRAKFLIVSGFDVDPNVLYNEDNAFHLKLAKAGLKFDYLPVITCINYWYKDSMSNSNELKCARANLYILRQLAESHGNSYPKEIAIQLWANIASLSVFKEWDYIKIALQTTRSLGFPYSVSGNFIFNLLTRIHPFYAIWIREYHIRLFKRRIRENK